jgi:hypothetical protein
MGSDKYVPDENGEPRKASLMEWAAWFESADRHVALDTIGDVDVSTVFLSFDHGFSGGPPVLWETMVFGGPLDGEQDRYTSHADAVAGHARILAAAIAATNPPQGDGGERE